MYQGERLMTGSGPAVMNQPEMPEAAGADRIETRFGQVRVYRNQPIIFPTGMLGMPEKNQFCLTTLPSPKMARFKLLQSLEDDTLSFLTLPVDVANPILA